MVFEEGGGRLVPRAGICWIFYEKMVCRFATRFSGDDCLTLRTFISEGSRGVDDGEKEKICAETQCGASTGVMRCSRPHSCTIA